MEGYVPEIWEDQNNKLCANTLLSICFGVIEGSCQIFD